MARAWDSWALGAVALGATAFAFWPDVALGVVAQLTAGPAQQGLIRALAEKWGKVFGVPPDWIMAIAKVESNFKPGATSTAASDAARGKAWGSMQVTYATAIGIAVELSKSSNAQVRAAMTKWNGQGRALLDPDLGVLFGTFYLSQVMRHFGSNFAAVAAAYNQGSGTVSGLVAASQFPAGLTPHGQAYLAKAEAARKAFLA